MNRKRIQVVVLTLAAAVALYALLGFLLVPYAAKRVLVTFVERDLGHRLAIGELRFNPFTFRTQVEGFELREPDGGAMLSARTLLVDFEASSLWRRAWTFADIAAQAPHLHVELRPNGRHNFSALLDALHDPKPKTDQPPPRLAIARIAIDEGRIDLADVQAGEAARLALAPIAFELTELTTEASDTAPYKLTARSGDGEQIVWNGEVSVNPAASKGRLVLQGWKFATLARWLGNRIALERAGGTLDVSLDYAAAFTAGAPTFTVSNLQAKIADLALVNRAASEAFAQLASLQVSGGTFDLATRTFGLETLEVARAALALEIGADGKMSWSGVIPKAPAATGTTTGPAAAPPATTAAPAPAAQAEGAAPASPAPSETAAPAPPGQAQAPAPEPVQAQPPASPPPVQAQTPAPTAEDARPWSGRIGRMAIVDSTVSYADRRSESAAEIALAGVRFETAAEATHSDGSSAITLSGVKGAIAELAVRSGTQSIQAADSALNSAGITAKLGTNGIELDAKAIEATLAKLALDQGNGNWQVATAGAVAESVRVSAADSGTRVEGSGLALKADGIAARLGQAAKSAIEVGAVNVHARTAALDPDAAGPGLRIDGVGAAIQAVAVRDPASGNELARLARTELEGASASTGKRLLNIGKISAGDAHAAVMLSAENTSNWEGLLAALGANAARAPEKPGPTPDAPWQVRVSSVELGNAGVGFTDARQDPALAVELQQVSVRARDISTDPRAKPMQIQVNARIKDGGELSAAGVVNAQTYASDLKVKLTGLSLLPLQPYVARYARVQIVSALASADGRLRYGYQTAAGADVVFEGDVGLDKVIVEETEPAQPLLAIGTLRAAQTRLTLGPNRLEIPDLRVDKAAARLIIAADQSVNIVKLLRQPAVPADAAAKPAASADAPSKTAPTEASDAADPFPIVISRLRLDNSVLDFADFSLTPPFDTRMHELQGVITGISTSADTRARMELDARVDEYGSAQIRGVMNLFKPHVFTNVDMTFRNLEMTDLTPYAAKFAGYRIASGKLSMDLQYRIRKGNLVGENKIVIDKLELGERVESPSALDLPLELAVAILKDENGRIDLGIPVSGSLDDPQFNIAAVVWKAIGNLLGRIVTAPFRALAGIFGGGKSAEELSAIEFDPGVARLLPQERQKLETVAEALAKRPQLKLTVKPAYAPKADRQALQSIAARREVLARAGIKLAPGESPGPLDYGNSRIRSAIEDVFTDAFGFPAARDLRANLPQRKSKPAAQAAFESKPKQAAEKSAPPSGEPAAAAGAEAVDDSKAPPESAAGTADAKPAAKPPEASNVRVARAMARRLIEAQPVDDAALAALARERGEAVAAALRDSARIDPARISIAAPQALEGDADRAVATRLELGVAN